MNWQTLAKKVIGIAPAVGGALAGPAGAVVGAAMAERLGVPATPIAVQRALEVDPEAAERIAEIEAQVSLAAIKDTQRAREAHKGHWMPAAMTCALIGIIAAVLGALFFVEIPAGNQRVADLVLGAVLGAFATGISYWLGSSRGSADKAETLDRMAKR